MDSAAGKLMDGDQDLSLTARMDRIEAWLRKIVKAHIDLDSKLNVLARETMGRVFQRKTTPG